MSLTGIKIKTRLGKKTTNNSNKVICVLVVLVTCTIVCAVISSCNSCMYIHTLVHSINCFIYSAERDFHWNSRETHDSNLMIFSYEPSSITHLHLVPKGLCTHIHIHTHTHANTHAHTHTGTDTDSNAVKNILFVALSLCTAVNRQVTNGFGMDYPILVLEVFFLTCSQP